MTQEQFNAMLAAALQNGDAAELRAALQAAGMPQDEFNTMLDIAIAQGIGGGTYISRYSGEEIDTLLGLTGYAAGSEVIANLMTDIQTAQESAEQAAADAEAAATNTEAAADRAEAANLHPPYIGDNGNWYVYNTTTNAYEDSGIDASITIEIADVTMLEPGDTPYVTNSGTSTDPVFHLFIPIGDIVSVELISSEGLVDTYTITITGGQTYTFQVRNGADAVSPGVTITEIAGGHRVTITDKDHPGGQSFDILDGTGTGDMRVAVYDPESAIAEAGGIPAYVASHAAPAAISITITLPASGWALGGGVYTQTVAVPGVLEDETKQFIIPLAAKKSESAYDAAGVEAVTQAANSLTFQATDLPSADLTVYIIIMEVTAV